jgi:hypothetical protein
LKPFGNKRLSLPVHVLRVIVETSATGRSLKRRAGVPHGSATRPKRIKGEEMKKYVSILLALVGVLVLAGAAQANIRHDIVVTLPFEYVAGGKTLPAGTYTINPVSNDAHDGVILTSRENLTSVIVHPIETQISTVEKPSVSFQLVGEQRFLTRIETNETVYDFPVSRTAIMLAAKQPHSSSAVSDNSGSN